MGVATFEALRHEPKSPTLLNTKGRRTFLACSLRNTIANRAVNAENYGTVGHPPSSRLFRKEKQ